MHRKCPFMYVLGCIQHMKIPVYMRMCELQNFCLLFLLILEPYRPRNVVSYVINSTCVRLTWTAPLNSIANTSQDVDVSVICTILMYLCNTYECILSSDTTTTVYYVCIGIRIYMYVCMYNHMYVL